MSQSEPKRLRKGRAFHGEVQAEWQRTADGDVTSEKGIVKPSGRPGRIDIHVDVEDGLVAVVEIKDSDWNAMSEKAVRRNIRRYAKQVWDYIDAEVGDDVSVSPGMIFPRRPSDASRLHLIEDLLLEQGIPVVWQDETIEERRLRAENEDKGNSGESV